MNVDMDTSGHSDLDDVGPLLAEFAGFNALEGPTESQIDPRGVLQVASARKNPIVTIQYTRIKTYSDFPEGSHGRSRFIQLGRCSLRIRYRPA